MVDIIKMIIDHLLQVFHHQLQDLDHLDLLDQLMITIIFLIFILTSPPPPSYNFDSPYIPPAPDPLSLPYYSKSNIKDNDGDYDFDINFPEKKLTPTIKFLLNSGNTKKDVTIALNNVKGELEIVREEKQKIKKG